MEGTVKKLPRICNTCKYYKPKTKQVGHCSNCSEMLAKGLVYFDGPACANWKWMEDS